MALTNVVVGVTSSCKHSHADPANMLATVGASHVITAASLFDRCQTAWAQPPVGSVLIKPHCHSVVRIASIFRGYHMAFLISHVVSLEGDIGPRRSRGPISPESDTTCDIKNAIL
jgi:hypothetical protein